MPTSRRPLARSLVAAAATALLSTAVWSASPAAAETKGGGDIDAGIPSDCVLDEPDRHTRGLTCTNRPAGQQWRLKLTCHLFGGPAYRLGNIVTGNGRSETSCGSAWEVDRIFFLVVS